MNVIAILNHMGVYFKEEPIRELHRALERLNFQIVYPNDRDDLLKLIKTMRVCAALFLTGINIISSCAKKLAK
ncbi:Orn/Lys/Arg decarboxylase N-terminal domain-containing protein [Escherichia coli]